MVASFFNSASTTSMMLSHQVKPLKRNTTRSRHERTYREVTPEGYYCHTNAGCDERICANHHLPDPTLTPGAVRTTNIGEICNEGSTRSLRHWSRERDDFIMREYGLPPGAHPNFEVDHLIALELGGADTDTNLWPEPRRTIEPIWNAERKDELENKLRDLVCMGALDPAIAQRAIADDWVAAFQHYIGEPR